MATTLLTGIPRSGTTLVCALLNEFPDCLALAEPLKLDCGGDRSQAVSMIEEFLANSRRQALAEGIVVSKHVGGHVPDNWVEPPEQAQGLRKVLEVHGPIGVGKKLSPDFHLFVKHPAEFSALAAPLLERGHDLWAIIRHPLMVLAAWQTVDMPVNRGRMPMAEVFLPALAALQDGEPDRLKRQINLLRWLLETYATLPSGRIIRYEDLLAAPEDTLARLTAKAARPERNLHSLDPAARYRGVDFASLARAALDLRELAEIFYPDFKESLAPHLRDG